MKFFLDSANLQEIAEINNYGLIDGITTNPTLIAKAGGDFKAIIAQICEMVAGPVSAEVASTEYNQMIKEGEVLSKIAKNVCIKLPLTIDGLKACRYFADRHIQTNVTLCFSAAQALLAAKAGATFVSPFVGRLDDIGQDGLELISEIVQIFANYSNITTQVLVASVRNPIHVTATAKMGAHVATLPGKIFKQMFQHPLTDNGLATFVADWASTGQKII